MASAEADHAAEYFRFLNDTNNPNIEIVFRHTAHAALLLTCGTVHSNYQHRAVRSDQSAGTRERPLNASESAK